MSGALTTGPVRWQIATRRHHRHRLHQRRRGPGRRRTAAAAGAAHREATRASAPGDDHHGFTLDVRDQLTEESVILPKLFRRLAEYLTLDNTGGVDLTGFQGFLQAKADRLSRPDMPPNLETLITGSGQHLGLTLPPEQIVFIEG